MKKLLFWVNRLGIKQLLVGCLFIGVLLGTACSNVLKEFYIDQIFLFDDTSLARISQMQLDPFAITGIAWIGYIKEFGLLVLLSVTMLGAPYILFHCTYKGFCMGFILSTAVMRYGVKGVLFFVCYISPQCLIYVPLLAMTYLEAYRANAELYSSVDRKELRIRNYIPKVFALLLLITITSLLEGYLNTSLLRMIMLELS